MIDLLTLIKIMPLCPRSRALLFLQPLNEAMSEYDIITAERMAAFLAQVAHESAQLRYVVELASGGAYDGDDDLGNTCAEAIAIAQAHKTTPGPMWKGRGLIQITGYDNYAACGRDLGLNLIESPQLLEQPDYAARSAGWFWDKRNLNNLADVGDFRGITKRINGGYNGYTDRVGYYQRAKIELGVTNV